MINIQYSIFNIHSSSFQSSRRRVPIRPNHPFPLHRMLVCICDKARLPLDSSIGQHPETDSASHPFSLRSIASTNKQPSFLPMCLFNTRDSTSCHTCDSLSASPRLDIVYPVRILPLSPHITFTHPHAPP